MEKQKIMYDSGNELAAFAAKQINYHVMGYYPITPSTQIAENLDVMGAEGLHDIALIAAEGEHSAAGICYGASAAGGRVFNATSANGLLYALEQFPVQSGTRMPMVMNVACRTVSGPLCIKGDHSDVMYLLNTGWIILFADEPQKVYDFNLLGLKLAEAVRLPVAVAFDGFFTSHQKRKCLVFENDDTVTRYIGEKLSCDNPKVSAFAGTGTCGAAGELPYASVLDLAHPVSIGSYMNEPDVINNRYQLHLAMEAARNKLPKLFTEYAALSGRELSFCGAYRHEDAEVLLFVLGSSYHTAMEAVDRLRQDGIAAGVIPPRILSRIYGLGGKDFFVEDALALFKEALSPDAPAFDYYGVTAGTDAPDAADSAGTSFSGTDAVTAVSHPAASINEDMISSASGRADRTIADQASGTSGKADQSMAAPAMQPQYFSLSQRKNPRRVSPPAPLIPQPGK